jgi:deazaflavin-dependent oxidoreductase (nitroreductase family)
MSSPSNVSSQSDMQVHNTPGSPTDGTRNARRRRRTNRPLLSMGTRLFNPFMRGLAGRRGAALFALVRHRGRRSGRTYATPVAARRTPDGFVLPLTFGQGADWFRNIQAAGGCVIRWRGADYQVVQPEVVAWVTVRSAFPAVVRALFPVFGIKQCVRLRLAPVDHLMLQEK